MWRQWRVKLNSLVAGRLLRHLAGRRQLEAVASAVVNSQVSQRVLYWKYRELIGLGHPPTLPETGFRVFSQADEDGLLLYVFSVIGFESRVCVDFGSASPYGANTTNLICNWGFTGLLVDGDSGLTGIAREFFRDHRDSWLHPPAVVTSWITAENCNDLVAEHGLSGEIDLLSIDLDGIDYWVWKSLEEVSPRVVIIEFQDIWGVDRSVTVPYAPGFRRPGPGYEYCGASLPALVKLAASKGYRLVGANRYGYNAVFVRQGLGEAALPEVAAESCLQHPRAARKRAQQADSLRFPWQEV